MRFKKLQNIASAVIITLTAALLPINGVAVTPTEPLDAPPVAETYEEPQITAQPTAEPTGGGGGGPTATGDPNKAWVIEDFLGKADNNGDVQLKPQDKPQLKKDDIIWLGVALDHLEKLQPALDEGVSNMEIALNYDPYYIAPCSRNGKTFNDVSASYTEENFIDDWLDYIGDYCMGPNEPERHNQKWNSDVYEFYDGCTPCTKVNKNASNTTNDDVTASMKMLYINIGRKDGVDTADWRLKGVDKDNNYESDAPTDKIEKKYVIMLPFKVMFDPENTAVTDKYLSMSLGPQTFVLGYGDTGYSDTSVEFSEKYGTGSLHQYGAWEADDGTGTRTGINLTTYLDFTEDVDLFEVTEVKDEIIDVYLTYETYGIPQATAAPGEATLPTADPSATLTPITVRADVYRTREYDPDTNPYSTLKDKGYVKKADYADQKFYVDLPPEATKVQLHVKRTRDDDVGDPFARFKTDFADPNSDYTSDEMTSQQTIIDMTESPKDEEGNFLYTNTDPNKFNLAPVDMEKFGGFHNVIQIVHGVDLIYIHARLKVEPRIELEYGNSPVGLIMRDDETFPTPDPTQPTPQPGQSMKELAIEQFETNNEFKDDEWTPKGGIKGRVYYTSAWLDSDDENVNMDRNKYALFGRYFEDITDPGISLYNEYDEPIEISEDNKVTRHIDYKLLDGSISIISKRFQDATDASYDDTLTGKAGEYKMPFEGKTIRPETLYIVYNYKKGEYDITAKRPLIILQRIGDINIDLAVTPADVTAINRMAIEFIPDEYLKDAEEAGAVFKFRVEDVNNDLAVTPADNAAINKMSVVPLIEYYNPE